MQLTIQARDKGFPPLSSQQNARVTVNVARNLNDPQFEGTPYNAAINRDVEVGSEVKEVRAKDNDNSVSICSQSFTCLGVFSVFIKTYMIVLWQYVDLFNILTLQCIDSFLTGITHYKVP